MSQEDNNVSTNIETTNVTTIEQHNNDTTEQYSNNNIENGKKNNNKIIYIIAVALVVLLILAGGFYYYFSKPSTIVTNLINSAYNKVDNILNTSNDFDIEKDTMLISGDLTIDTNIDGFKDLKNEKFGYSLGLDYKNQKIEAGLSLTEKKEKIIDAMLYFVNNKAYISFKDDFDKIINIDSKDFDFEDIFKLESDNDFNKDDINYIVKGFKDILLKSIDMDKLNKTTDTIELNGKEQKVTKISYKLNKENTKDFMKSFIDNTLDNEDLLKKLSDLSDTDVDDIKDSLKDLKDEDYDDIGTISIYTKGLTNKLVKLELESKNAKLGFIVNKDATEIYAKGNENSIILEVKEYNKEELNIDYTIKQDNNVIKGNVTFTAKETKKNNFEGTLSFSIKYDDYNFKIKSNYELEIDAKIADINTSKVIKSSSMSSSDLEKISNILEKIQKSNLYKLIEDLRPSNNYDEDYNYNYDSDYDYDFDDNFDYSYSY